MVGRIFDDVMSGRLRQPFFLRQKDDPMFTGTFKPVQHVLVLRRIVLVDEQDSFAPPG